MNERAIFDCIERYFTKRLGANVIIHPATDVDFDASLIDVVVTVSPANSGVAVSRGGFFGMTDIVRYCRKIEREWCENK